MRTHSILLLVVGLLSLAGILVLYWYAISSPYLISTEEAQQRLKENRVDVILDVRTEAERNMLGFYPNSVHIQSADLASVMPQKYPDKRIRILAYCNTGQRARSATDKLVAMGYTNVRYIVGSYQGLL